MPNIDKSASLNVTKVKTPSIVVFPGTTWESKLWPIDYWYELIKVISRNSQVFICGSTSDLEFTAPLFKKFNLQDCNCISLVGKTNVKDLICQIQNTNLVIGMDSFGLHLASAIKNDFGKPEVVGIYGSTSPLRNGPYSSISNCLYLSELECIACRKKHCPLGHHACMNNIIPSYVTDMVNSKLQAGSCNLSQL